MPILDLKNNAEVNKYENFIENSPYGSFMQSIKWSSVKNNWDSDYVYLTNNSTEIIAALSILSIKNNGENSFLYAPRGPVCDLSDVDLVNQLLEEANQVAKKRNAFLLRIDPDFAFDSDLLEKIGNNLSAEDYVIRSRDLGDEHAFSNPRQNMNLNISGIDYDTFLSQLTSKKRNTIKKTYKNNLHTESFQCEDDGYEEALNTFYRLIEVTSQRQNITYRPKEYFERVLENFDEAYILQTSDSEEVLASSIVLFYNQVATYLYSASSNKKTNLNAPRQMVIELIKEACNRNMEEVALGGVFETDLSDGLYRFKHWFTGDDGLSELLGEIDIVYNRLLYREFTE